MIGKIRIKQIEYNIESEDIRDIEEDDYALRSDYIKECENRVDEILESLPSEITVSTDKIFTKESDLQEFLEEEITSRTGWLVKSFEYEKE